MTCRPHRPGRRETGWWTPQSLQLYSQTKAAFGSPPVTETSTTGLLLAGGRSTRMGGIDKSSLKLGGRTLIERGIARARPQVKELLISANEDIARFAHLGLEIISDNKGGFLGPLAGILAGLEWMQANRPEFSWLATFACDTPFFPPDLVEKLLHSVNTECALVAIAASGDQHHPVFGIWNTALLVPLQEVLAGQGSRKVDDFVARFPNTRVTFKANPVDPFFNINTPSDLAYAETLLERL
jgi:molybdopterin-guanine dinucleotide biosynthesis protein A